MAITKPYEEKYQDEYNKAIIRVYGNSRQTPEHRSRLVMEWILRLAFMDADYMSDGDLHNLKYEVACFTDNGETEGNLQKDKMRPLQKWIYVAPLDNEYENDEKIDKDEQEFWIDHLPTKEAIRKLIDITYRHTTGFIITGFMTVKLPELRISVSKKMKSTWTKSPIDVFQYHFSYMIAKYANLIIRCPECKKIILASRSDRQYCSVNCQSRVNMRRYRAEKQNKKNKGGSNHGKAKRKR